MNYNFDDIVDRKNTDSLKFDFAVRRGKPEGLLPLWVADMDFRAPDAVLRALEEKSRHGIFGYSESREDYFRALKNWFSSRFEWEVDSRWLVKVPGVVFGLCAAIRAFTREGDAVMIQQPVYYPFSESVLANGRRLAVNQLIYNEGKYTVDFEDMERQITEQSVKLFILCSPHNPVGRVWTKDELEKMGEICLRHGVLVVSDEIHADFVYPGRRHYVFASLRPEFRDITVTCTAPSKTFNLAGLQVSNIFIADRELKRRFREEIVKTGYSQLGVMGLTACRVAYEQGGEWLDELKRYLTGNLKVVREFLRRLPEIRLVEPEGTYLIWLDFRRMGLTDEQLEALIEKKARLWLDGGAMFGAGGEGFQRINIACPRAVLEQAMTQLERAVTEYRNAAARE